MADGLSGQTVRLAQRAGRRQAGDSHPLAPQRVPSVLAVEAQAARKTTFATRLAEPDSHDGEGQSHVGTGPHRPRAAAKLGIRVSPRTVARYLPDEDDPGRAADPAQRWLTFVRNHAQAMVACDFFVVVTARFRVLYVFVLMELGTRRILHHNITAHPTAQWTLQQFREALPGGHRYRFVIHDRDRIFGDARPPS